MSENAPPILPKKQISMDLPHEHFRSNTSSYVVAWKDMLGGLTKINVWTALAWEEFISRYKRSYLGILWAVFGFMIFTLLLVFFRMAITGRNSVEHGLWVVFGFLSFQLIMTGINDGTGVFLQASNWLRSSRLPFSLFIYRGITRAMIVFFFNVVGAGFILFYFKYQPPVSAWMAIPGLAVIILNAIWIYMFLGVLCARYRDLGHLINSMTRMMLFISPVVWEPGEGGMRTMVAKYNPISYFMEVVRGPLLDQAVPLFTWQVIGCITVIGYIVAFVTFAHFRNKLILWI